MPRQAGRPPRAQQQGQAVRELAVVHQLLTTRLNRALRPLGLTMTHTSLLFHLAGTSRPCSVNEIAAAMEVNQPAVSKTLRTLAERGAVSVGTDAEDARRRTVELTTAGQDLLHQAISAMHPEAGAALEPLSDGDLDTLLTLLHDVRTHLDTLRDT
ncbi:MarR family winged helix-turn-helix transcriptional regulator [Streptomyces sp. NPDC048337]|uniref:MarR family winged helix-turn-helix transcriptional regulator n=1 Tax=Streptomyces sp. NPDC048337 TaxID=3365535 RepID=UPI003717F38F